MKVKVCLVLERLDGKRTGGWLMGGSDLPVPPETAVQLARARGDELVELEVEIPLERDA